MSKKNTVNGVATMNIMDAVREFTGGAEISMKAFALALDIPANRLYAIAKRPIVRQVYDPNANNWDSISEFLTARVSAPDATIASVV